MNKEENMLRYACKLAMQGKNIVRSSANEQTRQRQKAMVLKIMKGAWPIGLRLKLDNESWHLYER